MDLGVFSSLKGRYRDLFNLRQLEGIKESSVTGKRVFLNYYRLVRKEGLSEYNIRSGFKVRGLWLVNISKPLISRHLVANNKACIRRKASFSTPGPLTAQGATLEDYGHVFKSVATPKKAKDIKVIL